MKASLLIAIFIMLGFGASAQLKNTKWKGVIAAPTDVEVVAHFKADTLDLIISGTNRVIESMKYSVKSDIITINKISGGSPCSNNEQATIKYAIKDNKLTFEQIADPCDERKTGWPVDGFTKM